MTYIDYEVCPSCDWDKPLHGTCENEECPDAPDDTA